MKTNSVLARLLGPFVFAAVVSCGSPAAPRAPTPPWAEADEAPPAVAPPPPPVIEAPVAQAPTSTCTSVADLPALTVLAGRPYGVFSGGIRRLDRPGSPVAAAGALWPTDIGDARLDRLQGMTGTWPHRLAALLDRPNRSFPPNGAYALRSGVWKRLNDPPAVEGYLQVAPASQDRVVAIGVTGETTRLFVLAGPDRFPGAGLPPGSGGCAVAARSFALAVSPSGRVAAARERCFENGRAFSPVVEVFDERLRSQSRTPIEAGEGPFPIAWLDDETLFAGTTASQGSGPARLVKITAGKTTDLALPRGDRVVGFNAAEGGGLLVVTTRHLLRIGRDAALEGSPTAWASFLELDPVYRATVSQIAIGEDNARYVEISESTGGRVLRCPVEKPAGAEP